MPNRVAARLHPLSARRPAPLIMALAGLVLAAAALLAAPQPAKADGFIIPEPPRNRPIPWRDIPLAIRYHRVDVRIRNQLATTTVDQVFVNESGFAVEGTYIFPLPEDAAVSSFEMWVDGKRLEGKLLGKDEARAIYEEIVRRQLDPALLEYVGRGAWQARIFPIPPGGERRIQLTYSQVLARDNGLVRYRYPLNTEKFSSRNLEEVAITVELEDASPLRAIYSPSHEVAVARDGSSRASVSYEARNVKPDRDFDLYYSLSTDSIAVNLLTYKPAGEDGFFLMLLAPPLESARQEVVAKDVMLVLDTSGSMEGEKLAQAKTAAQYVLDHLGSRDRFNLIGFSSFTSVFADGPVGADRLADGRRWVQRLVAAGSTDIGRALLEASASTDPERPTVVIFLTDGLPTAGITDPERIAQQVRANAPKSLRLFSFGVGYDVDTLLLDRLSENHRGVSSYVVPGAAIDEEVSTFYAKVSAPVLVDATLKIDGVRIEDLYPNPLPDLFAGSQLVIAGRYRDGGAARGTLSGVVNDRAVSYGYPALTFVRRGGDEFVARVWAQRKIGHLLTQIRLNGASKEVVDEIVSLSTRYGIVSPYTSFLVEEPALALTDAGRRELGETFSAPLGIGGGGGVGGVAAPAAAPNSGAEAVGKAMAEGELRAADQALAPAGASASVVRVVRGKTFLLSDGAWVDTIFDAAKQRAQAVKFGSDAYFKLIAEHPEVAKYLALGQRVTVVFETVAYRIEP